MPATFTGLLLFLVFILPGYVWVHTAEVRETRPDRSGLTEAAELAFVGLISSTISATVVFSISDLSLERTIVEGAEYFRDHALVAIQSLVAIFGLSIFGTWGAAHLRFRSRPLAGHLRPGSTPWHDALTAEAAGRRVSVQVVTHDGHCYWGTVVSYTVRPDVGVPDIVLGPTITVAATHNQSRRRLRVDRCIVPGNQISEVQVRFLGDRRPTRNRWWLPSRYFNKLKSQASERNRASIQDASSET